MRKRARCGVLLWCGSVSGFSIWCVCRSGISLWCWSGYGFSHWCGFGSVIPKWWGYMQIRIVRSTTVHIRIRKGYGTYEMILWQGMFLNLNSLKVWWQDATLFVYFHIFRTYIHSFNHNTFIRLHSLKPLSISSSLVCSLSGEDLHVVQSRESNSGLSYSKPTRCQLSHAPIFK